MRHTTTSVHLRGKTYWFRGTIPGFGYVQRSLGTGNLGQALIAADKLRADPGIRLRTSDLTDYSADQKRRGVSDAWITDNRLILAAALEACGVDSPRKLTARKLQGWLDGISKRTTAAAYARRMATFMKWMVRSGRIDRSPCDELSKIKAPPSVRKRFLSVEEARALQAAAGDDKELRFILLCGLHAGMRKGEIVASRPAWFDVQRGLIHIQNEQDWSVKDRTNRTVPMTPEFRSFLADYPMGGPFMIAPDIASDNGGWRYRYDFARRFKAAQQRAGIDCTFHDLRRTFASLLVSSGVSVYKVSRWLGDCVAVVERHYGHLIAEDDTIATPWQ